MAENNELLDRRVVPRWRTFRETVASNELSDGRNGESRVLDAQPFLQEKELDWLENKELPFAVDLVSAASMFGKSEAALLAADFILENHDKATHVAVNLAAELVGTSAPKAPPPDLVSEAEIRDGLKGLKARRISQPGNAFVWADLARLYVLLGQKEQARQAILIALNLAPSERFIIRSASRFFLHNNEQDIALKLLRSNPRTPLDPWLTAAEIAVSSIVKKTPRFVRFARELIVDQNIQTFHKSELASSLATLELSEGSNKRANRMFQFSLKQPTENAVAQYVWASKKNGLSEIDRQLLQVRDASEARTFDAHNNAEWGDVVRHAHEWSRSELFSARPRMIAATTASYFLKDTRSTEAFLKEGLKINPGHPGMVNSLAFSLAWRDEPEEAGKILNSLSLDHINPTEALCLVATAGLTLIRSGNIEEGKSLYQKAIASVSRSGNIYLKCLADLHFSFELARIGEPKAEKEFARAYDNAVKQKGTNLPFIAEMMTKRGGKSPSSHPDQKNHAFLAKIDAILKREILNFGPSPSIETTD